MTSVHDLDRLLVTLDVQVQSFAACEIRSGRALVGAPVDAIMVHYVLAGTMHMTIPGQPTVVCGPGCVALIPPGMEPTLAPEAGPAHEVITLDSATMRDDLMIFDAACGQPGDLRIVAGVILASTSGSFGLLDKLTAPISENVGDIPFVRGAFAMMLEEISRPTMGGRALTSSLMKTCLLLVIRRFFARPEADTTLIGALADPRLGAAVGAVLEKPGAAHSVAGLADCAGMSRSNFARLFVAEFGIGPMEFVARTRLRHAADLLRSIRLPIKVIAASIGFMSRSHFSRAFREAYGADPSAFRQADGAAALDAPAAAELFKA